MRRQSRRAAADNLPSATLIVTHLGALCRGLCGRVQEEPGRRGRRENRQSVRSRPSAGRGVTVCRKEGEKRARKTEKMEKCEVRPKSRWKKCEVHPKSRWKKCEVWLKSPLKKCIGLLKNAAGKQRESRKREKRKFRHRERNGLSESAALRVEMREVLVPLLDTRGRGDRCET